MAQGYAICGFKVPYCYYTRLPHALLYVDKPDRCRPLLRQRCHTTLHNMFQLCSKAAGALRGKDSLLLQRGSLAL